MMRSSDDAMNAAVSSLYCLGVIGVTIRPSCPLPARSTIGAVRSDAATVGEYLAELPEDRRTTLVTVRDVVLAHLPDGFEEAMRWGMISYEIPLDRYPDTYNGEPLSYAGLASQTRHLSLYLHSVYADPALRDSFAERAAAAGKRLDMGKSCIRFKRIDQLPLELIGEVLEGTSVDDYIAHYEASRRGPG